MTDPTRQAVERYFQLVGAPEEATADRETFVAQFSPDVEFADPVGGPVMHGHEGVAKFHKGLGRAWSTLRLTPTAIYTRGPRAAAHWTAEGTSTTGKRISFGGVNTFRVDEAGRLDQVEGYWDFDGVIGQM
jgi:hypothetical protein